MAEIEVNGVGLHYELDGQGDGLVFVHGSWADHQAMLEGLQGQAGP